MVAEVSSAVVDAYAAAEVKNLKQQNADLLRMIAELQKRVSWLEEVQKDQAKAINEIKEDFYGDD